MSYLADKKIIMSYVISNLSIAQTLYLENQGLCILEANHIFLQKKKILSSQIQINEWFIYIDERKRERCDRNIHKFMRIPIDIYQKKKKMFATVQSKTFM